MSLELESLRVQSLWLLKKGLSSREESDISLSIINSKACFHLACKAHIISLKHSRALNTLIAMILYSIRMYIERVTSHKRKNHFVSRCEG